MRACRPRWPRCRADNERLTGLAGLSGDKDARIAALDKELADKASMSNEALAKVDLLNQQLLALRRQMAALQEALNAAEAKDKDSQARIADLGARLNVVLARQVQELQRYRSDFFGRLRDLLRDRKDIRVVGDRFVFQSEVLFPSGQATMTLEGLAAMDQLAAAIVELERSIPKEIDWALQVDGHTDVAPDRQPAVPLQLGAVQRARHLGGEVPDQPRRVAQAPGGRRLRRVPAPRGGRQRRHAAPQPPHRAEADEQVRLSSSAEFRRQRISGTPRDAAFGLWVPGSRFATPGMTGRGAARKGTNGGQQRSSRVAGPGGGNLQAAAIAS